MFIVLGSPSAFAEQGTTYTSPRGALMCQLASGGAIQCGYSGDGVKSVECGNNGKCTVTYARMFQDSRPGPLGKPDQIGDKFKYNWGNKSLDKFKQNSNKNVQ